jgi:hypothetical protein
LGRSEPWDASSLLPLFFVAHAVKVEQLLHVANAEAEQKLSVAKVEAERMVASAQQEAQDAQEREQTMAEDDSSTDDEVEAAAAARNDTRAAELEAALRVRFEALLAAQLAETLEAQRQLAEAQLAAEAKAEALKAAAAQHAHGTSKSPWHMHWQHHER